MLYIDFFKGQPTEYVIKFVNGKIKNQGQGLSFFYWKPSTTVISIPTTTIDAQFIFNEITKTYQIVTIQGQLTYRINDVQKMHSILDFSIDPVANKYLSEDPEKLSQRIINVVQMATRSEVQELSLEDTLRKSESLARVVIEKVQSETILKSMGIECVSIFFTSIKPTPELSKALEAEYRENLQKKADEAIYSRRAAAVEQERKIRENELDSQITIERNRQQLVELNGNNIIKEAEYKSKAMDIEFSLYKNIEPKLLLALGLKSLGENADKIGSLMITPDVLSSILQERSQDKG